MKAIMSFHMNAHSKYCQNEMKSEWKWYFNYLYYYFRDGRIELNFQLIDHSNSTIIRVWSNIIKVINQLFIYSFIALNYK